MLKREEKAEFGFRRETLLKQVSCFYNTALFNEHNVVVRIIFTLYEQER